MTTAGFRLCTGCKDRLAAMKRDVAVQCSGQHRFGGQCRKRTSDPSGACWMHR